jgi:hypothetical protein
VSLGPLLLDVDIRLFLGFVRSMRKSGMAVVASSFYGGGRLVGCGRWRVGKVLLPVKIKLRRWSWWEMASFSRCYLVEGITFATRVYSLVQLRENPRSRYARSDHGALFFGGHHFQSSCLKVVASGGMVCINPCRWHRVSMVRHIGDSVSRRIGDSARVCDLMDLRGGSAMQDVCSCFAIE